MSSLSRKIRETRRRRGLSQADFAKAVGVTQSTVSKWESGAQRPDVNAAITLAVWAGEPAQSFMFEEDEHSFITEDIENIVYVVGAAESGKWLEKINWDEEDQFKVEIPFKNVAQMGQVKGWLIRDIGIEKLYPHDSIVFCKTVTEISSIGNYDRVLVVRENQDGLLEITVREIAKYKDIIVNLRAHPVEPDPELSFDLKPPRLGPGIRSVHVIGVVVASFAFEPQRDPAPSPGWTY